MPTYEINIPGSGKYQVQSDTPLSDTEAYNYALAQAKPRGAVEEFGRGAGLAARGAAPVLAGAALGAPLGPVGSLAGMLALPTAELATQAANVILPQQYQIPSPSSAVEGLLTKIGFPTAETTGERAIQAGGGALTGTAGQLSTLPTMAKTATTEFGRAISSQLAQQPTRQLAAAVPSAMAAQTVAEETGSPIAGMTAGMVTGAPFGAGVRQPVGPSREQISKQAVQSFDRAKQAGIAFKPQEFTQTMGKIAGDLRQEGYTPTAYPKVDAALKELQDPSIPKDFTELQALRKIVQNAQASTDPAERRLATILKERFDDYVVNAPVSDLAGTNTKTGTVIWKQARDQYSRQMKSDIFEKMLANAELDQSKFTQSGAENSMAQQLRQLAKSDKQMRLFTKDEQTAIKTAAKGTTAQNLLKFYGRFAPTGPVGGLFAGGATMYEPTIGLPFTVGAIGARAGATALRKRSVENLADIMRAGGAPQIPKNLAPIITGGRGLLTPLNVSQEELQQIYGQ
jgi:hypothetical protein